MLYCLILLQPWLMRLSRVIYIRFFVSYDENYEVQSQKNLNSFYGETQTFKTSSVGPEKVSSAK